MLPIGAEDEDVARERERVKSGRAQGDILTMTDLSKVQHMTSVWLVCIKMIRVSQARLFVDF